MARGNATAATTENLTFFTCRPPIAVRLLRTTTVQVGTGARTPATRCCAMFFKALGETTNPTKPVLFTRELGRHSFE